MWGGGQDRFGDAIASALGWWVEAGVDTSIAETPRDWLIPPTRSAPVSATAGDTTTAAMTAKSAALPADLAVFQLYLAEQDYLPEAPPARRRVTPFGDPASGLMIVADMPDPADLDSRQLLGGDTAPLFDAMLAALGRTRETVYVAPLSPARFAGGRIGADVAEPLARLMRHHIALVRPRAMILMGEETCRALLGIGRAEARGASRSLNHDGGTVPAVVIPHPRMLRQHPAAKADAWREMRRLTGVLVP